MALPKANSASKDVCLESFRHRVEHDAEAIKTLHKNGCSASQLVAYRVETVDRVLKDVWELFMASHEINNPCCLVAVGGYGREELNPHSDIDIMTVLGTGCNDNVNRSIEQMVRFFWDIGFEVGHSVRTLSDCISQSAADITVMTNLLESRYCAGHQSLYRELETSLQQSKIWPARKFFKAKLQEQRNRHRKFADTAYNLEPNIKEGPGGLRDIHTVSWVTKRHFGSRNLRELVDRGFLHNDEYQTLIEGRNYLWRLRNELHFELGRRDDRLLFSHQLKLAKNFGFTDDNANKAVEKLMKTYFSTVKELRHINQILLQHYEESFLTRQRSKIKTIDHKFQMVDGFLDLIEPDKVSTQPEVLLEVCCVFQNNGRIRGVRAKTLRLMRSNRMLINSKIRRKPTVQSMLRSIFATADRLPETLGLMDDTGLLGRLVPQFKRITGQLQYDLFHVYTVDAHLLNVVRNLHSLTLSDSAKTFPLAAEAMSRIIKIERLFLAGLFHDIAKGQGGDHSELGEHETFAFCKKLGMDDYDSHLIAWLVRNHLAMSFTSQREDLNDSGVIARFAVKVGNQEHLDHLLLLTVADMQGTGPTVWNDWKGKMLEHLYLATSHMLLTDTLPHREIEPRIEEIKIDTLAVIGRNSQLKDVANRLWELCDDEYFLSYDANTIAWHVENCAKTNAIALPCVNFRVHPSIDVYQIFVIAAKSEELFAIIAGAIDRCYLNVVEARTHPLKTGLTVFTFVVLVRQPDEGISDTNLRKFESEVRSAMVNRIVDHSPRLVAQDRVARHIAFPTQVRFTRSPNNDYTIMEVTAQDRPGLLYHVVRALLDHKIHLLSAKITTSGARVEDVFFIVDRDDEPLQDEAVQRSLEVQIIKALVIKQM